MPQPNHQPSSGGKRSGSAPEILKWVGAATALFSLILGAHQVLSLVANSRERIQRIAELEKTAAVQQDETDYAAAWNSFNAARQLAESGGIFAELTGRQNNEIRRSKLLQENLAMEWMENVSLIGDQKFSEVVDKIEPILQSGAESATGARKADLLAHIGWGVFLRHRDGFSAGDPEKLYREALQVDRNNPYALANMGHWELWKGSAHLHSARPYFHAALASRPDTRTYVRRIELAALEGFLMDDECAAELLREVNEMRKNGEPIDEKTRNDVFSIYYFAFSEDNEESIKRILADVPPAEQVMTFQALFVRPEFDSAKIPSRQAYLALLQAAAGDCDESQRTLAAHRSSASPGDKSSTPHLGTAIKCIPARH
jgi:hypothetical protein